MKSSVLKYRCFAALAVTALVAACGGYTTVSLGGSVSGLITEGLVLENGPASVTVPMNATSYTFPEPIGDDAPFNVTVRNHPARLTCTVPTGKGQATGISINTANVICTVNTYTLGGTITGLTSADLKLNNGDDIVSPAAGATSFVFTNKVAHGNTYGVTVLQQPTGQVCTIQNETATMGGANVTNVAVTCGPASS